MNIHVGKIIKENENNLTLIKFAAQINTTRENAYGIFKRKIIDKGLLMRISATLYCNFFKELSNATNQELNIPITHKKPIALAEIATTTNIEIDFIKRENELLKDVIRLLKDKYEKL